MEGGYLEIRSTREQIRGQLSGLEENPFWNKSSEPELKVHRIHAYPAKFPAFIATKALAFAKSEGVRVRTIGDVFCGCGTVAFEARRSAIDFWGCDINPVATLIASTKSKSYRPSKFERHYEDIVGAFRDARADVGLSEVAIARLRYWYPEKQFRDLAKLLNAITDCTSARSRYRNFFLCAFSNILKSTSRWLTKSIKPQVDPDKSPGDVMGAFAKQFTLMADAWKEAKLPSKSTTCILNANILELASPPRNIDMIVTSPPYVTSYEYADLHQLSSLWLGYASDYRELRKGSIGSTQHNLDFNREIKHLNNVGSQVVFGLFDRRRSIARSAAKYFLDMQRVAQCCFRLLRRSGVALFVIGNTEYEGVRIDNAAHLVESLLSAGFSRVRVAKRRTSGKILTPYRDCRGRFSHSGAGRHVYGEEFVLIANK